MNVLNSVDLPLYGTFDKVGLDDLWRMEEKKRDNVCDFSVNCYNVKYLGDKFVNE